MDVQKELADSCPDMISPAGARQLNTPLCKCLCTKTASGQEKNVRVNRTRAQIPPVLDSVCGTCHFGPHHPIGAINRSSVHALINQATSREEQRKLEAGSADKSSIKRAASAGC